MPSAKASSMWRPRSTVIVTTSVSGGVGIRRLCRRTDRCATTRHPPAGESEAGEHPVLASGLARDAHYGQSALVVDAAQLEAIKTPSYNLGRTLLLLSS